MTTTTTTTADLTATTACKCQQLFAVELADASENIMPTSSLLLSQLRCNRRRHLWRNGTRSYAIRLWWGPVFNVLAAAQRIATELASTRAAAVEISTADAAHAQQVFRLLAWRFVLFTRGAHECREHLACTIDRVAMLQSRPERHCYRACL